MGLLSSVIEQLKNLGYSVQSNILRNKEDTFIVETYCFCYLIFIIYIALWEDSFLLLSIELIRYLLHA